MSRYWEICHGLYMIKYLDPIKLLQSGVSTQPLDPKLCHSDQALGASPGFNRWVAIMKHVSIGFRPCLGFRVEGLEGNFQNYGPILASLDNRCRKRICCQQGPRTLRTVARGVSGANPRPGLIIGLRQLLARV